MSVTHTDDLRPRNLCVHFAERRRDPARRLPDDLDQVGEGKAESLVRVEVRATLPSDFLDLLAGGIQHVADVESIIPRHTGLLRRRARDPESARSETLVSRDRRGARPGV